jgi:hypothetical protein
MNNVWTPIAGIWWAVKGTSKTKVDICMRGAPGLRCPGGECKEIRLNQTYTFSNGYTVRARGSGGSYPGNYADIDVIPPSIIPTTAVPFKTRMVRVDILIPNRDAGYTSYTYDVSIPAVAPIGVKVPIGVPTISKTLIVTRIPSSVFTGDTRTLIGAVDVGGLPVTGEPVVLKVDGVVVDETVTSNGVFVFEYLFDEAGSRKLVFESPATSAYPDYGRDVKRVSVSSVSPDIAERARIEHEEYIARREALAEKRIAIPEFGYEPIFRRDVSIVPVVETPPIVPEIPFVEPEVQIPTRGLIHVDLPIPPVDMPLIEIPVAVWVDNIFKGNAPITVSDIKVGPHSVVLKMAGFNSPVMTVEVNENEVSYVTDVEMIPL